MALHNPVAQDLCQALQRGINLSLTLKHNLLALNNSLADMNPLALHNPVPDFTARSSLSIGHWLAIGILWLALQFTVPHPINYTGTFLWCDLKYKLVQVQVEVCLRMFWVQWRGWYVHRSCGRLCAMPRRIVGWNLTGPEEIWTMQWKVKVQRWCTDSSVWYINETRDCTHIKGK